jgi:hypothetical protein
VFAAKDSDERCLKLAARAYGRLVRSPTAEYVATKAIGYELEQKLEWLRPQNQQESWRLAAALVVREIANAAPALFVTQADEFFSNISTALLSPTLAVRVAGAKALGAALAVVTTPRYRPEGVEGLFKKVWEKARQVLLGGGDSGDSGGGGGLRAIFGGGSAAAAGGAGSSGGASGRATGPAAQHGARRDRPHPCRLRGGRPWRVPLSRRLLSPPLCPRFA